MRAAAALLAFALLASGPVAAAPLCYSVFFVMTCSGPFVASNAAGADVFVAYAPLVVPPEWRSAHVVAGLHGGGAAVHGTGRSTGGPVDVWLSVSPGGAQADAYSCFSYPPFVPGGCSMLVDRLRRMVPGVPSPPAIPLLP